MTAALPLLDGLALTERENVPRRCVSAMEGLGVCAEERGNGLPRLCAASTNEDLVALWLLPTSRQGDR